MTHKAILQSNSGTDTHTSNVILDEKLLSCGTIGKFSAAPLPANPIVMEPQTLMTHAVKKIFLDVTSGNAWNSRTPRQVIRMGINVTTPGNIGHACGISETSSPDMIWIIGATAPPCGHNVIQEIRDILQSTSPYFIKSNKLDTSINRQFANNLVAPPIFFEVIGDKLSDSSIRDLYTRCRMNLAEDPVNIPAP